MHRLSNSNGHPSRVFVINEEENHSQKSSNSSNGRIEVSTVEINMNPNEKIRSSSSLPPIKSERYAIHNKESLHLILKTSLLHIQAVILLNVPIISFYEEYLQHPHH